MVGHSEAGQMSGTPRRLLLALGLAGILAITWSPAAGLAQDQTAPAEQADDEKQATAEGEAADDESPYRTPEASEELTVTARRREENVQEVPVAVTVKTAEALEDAGTADIGELQGEVPNLSIYAGRNQSTTLTAFLRGVGQADPLWGVDPGVGLYMDDVYIARPQEIGRAHV